MTEDSKRGDKEGVVEELGELGRQLGEAFKAAWKSRERVELQRQIAEGLDALGEQFEVAVRTAREGDTLKGLQKDIKDAVVKAGDSEPVQDIRRGLTEGLRELNRELGDLVSSWRADKAPNVPPDEG